MRSEYYVLSKLEPLKTKIFVLVFALMACVLFLSASNNAYAQTRSLKLHYLHTGEKAVITFKKNGRYVKSGLRKLNRFLRDWRRNEPTKMDPRLFDLVWEAYRQTGSRNYIKVISGYRSPKTNAMLRRTRGGQAKRSQHMLGKALDFYIPGVKLSKLRAIGMKLQGGGVGYYPRSGSPFVHLDVGNVRAWPRMSRSQLTRLFPNGRTLHLPSKGGPLKGYKRALADYKRRRGAPAVSRQVASKSDDDGEGNGSFLSRLFKGGQKPVKPTPAPRAPKFKQRNVVSAEPAPAPVAKTPSAATVMASLSGRALPRPVTSPRKVATQKFRSRDIKDVAPPKPQLPEAIPFEVKPQVVRAPNVPQDIPFQVKPRDNQPSRVASLVPLDKLPAPQFAPNRPTQLAQVETLRPIAIAAALPAPQPRREANVRLEEFATGQQSRDKIDRMELAEALRRSVINRKSFNSVGSIEPRDGAVKTAQINREPKLREGTLGAIAVKMARVGAGQQSKTAKPTLSEVKQPARLDPNSARWALSSASVPLPTQGQSAKDILRETPVAVYNKGFTLDDQQQVFHNRFTGNAVTFLTVTKFQSEKD